MSFLKEQIAEDEAVAKALQGATHFLYQEPDFYGAGEPAALAFWD